MNMKIYKYNYNNLLKWTIIGFQCYSHQKDQGLEPLKNNWPLT